VQSEAAIQVGQRMMDLLGATRSIHLSRVLSGQHLENGAFTAILRTN
jgi:hypothetical protein